MAEDDEDRAKRSAGLRPVRAARRPGCCGCSCSSSSRWSTLVRTSLSEKDEPLRSQRHRASRGSCRNYTRRHQRLLASSSSARSSTPASPRVLCILIGYPLAYVIAFRGGRFRNVLLGLVVVPFFTSFLIRTMAWETILGRPGPGGRRSLDACSLVGVLDALGIIERRPAAGHPRRGDRRAHLQLPAVHDPADLRQPREDRPAASSTRPRTSTTTAGRRSARSCCRCRCPGCSPAACSRSSRPPATSSTPSSSASPKNTDDRHRRPGPVPVQIDYPTAAALSFVLMVIITDRRADLRPRARHGGPRLMAATSRRRRRRPAASAVGASRRWRSPASSTCSCRSS